MPTARFEALVLLACACACGKKDDPPRQPAATPRTVDAAPAAPAVDAAVAPVAEPQPRDVVERIVAAMVDLPDADTLATWLVPLDAARTACPELADAHADQLAGLQQALTACARVGRWPDAFVSAPSVRPRATAGGCPSVTGEQIRSFGSPPEELAPVTQWPLEIDTVVIDGKRYIEKLRCE